MQSASQNFIVFRRLPCTSAAAICCYRKVSQFLLSENSPDPACAPRVDDKVSTCEELAPGIEMTCFGLAAAVDQFVLLFPTPYSAMVCFNKCTVVHW